MRFEYEYIRDRLIEEKVIETQEQINKFKEAFEECLINQTMDLFIVDKRIRGFFMWYEMPQENGKFMRIFIDKMYIDKGYKKFGNLRELLRILLFRYKNLSLIYWFSNKKQKYIYREVING